MVYINRKIKGAKEHIKDGVKYRSKLELDAAEIFEKAGINAEYESQSFELLSGFKTEENGKIKTYRNWEYTPDFIWRDKKIFIEIKGFPNDVYPYKKKMFLKKYIVDGEYKDWKFYELHSKKEIISFVNEFCGSQPA